MRIIKKDKRRLHEYDSVEDYIKNYDRNLNEMFRDNYRLNVEIEDIINKTTDAGDFYFLLLKSSDNKSLRGVARVAVKKSFLGSEWETYPSDIVRAKKGDKVTIGGFHYELDDAIKGAEIPIRFLRSLS